MNAQHKLAPAFVLMKAFTNACVALGVTPKEKAKIIGVNPSTLLRNNASGFSPDSKTGELQLQMVRLYRSLHAIAGGDRAFMCHWYRTDNHALNGNPATLCQSIVGLLATNEYLDAMRGKV